MKKILHPSLTLGARKPYLSQRESALARLDMILHTRQGDLPWKSQFGCDVTGLVGEPATPDKLNETKAIVENTIQRWLPDANVKECQVQLVSLGGYANTYRDVSIPVAESALVAMGTEAGLELKIDLEIEEEILEVGTEFDL